LTAADRKASLKHIAAGSGDAGFCRTVLVVAVYAFDDKDLADLSERRRTV
jgi:hypothetical protein